MLVCRHSYSLNHGYLSAENKAKFPQESRLLLPKPFLEALE